MFFQSVPEGPPDAVFGLIGAFKADPRPNKVNLLIGVYKNEQLQTEFMPSVRKAQEEIADTLPVDYLPIDGSPDLIESLGPVLFGRDFWSANVSRIYGAQAVGGTNALRLGGEFIAQEVTKTIYIPHPSWPNHRSIFERAGCKVETYPYYSRSLHGFNYESFLACLKILPPNSAVLLHAACHNPTGCDPTSEEWAAIARLMRERRLLPFFDFAYQGLGDGIEEDAAAIRHFASEGLEFLVAYSCSKNFSMYSQRVAALYVVNSNSAEKIRVASQIKRIIRALNSNPPSFGATIVAHILKGPLHSQWENDLTVMRKRLQTVRSDFVHRLMKESSDFRPLLQHRGMFSYIDLEKPEVLQLRDRFGIYMLESGRISIAGLNAQNLDYVAHSIITVKQ